jgi:hypothetical protein
LVWGPRCGTRRVGAVLEHGRSCRGWGVGMEGAVVMGCDEPLARGGGAVERVGAVWFGANRAGQWAFRDAAGLLLVGWRAGGVVTRLSQAVRNMVGRREIR